LLIIKASDEFVGVGKKGKLSQFTAIPRTYVTGTQSTSVP